MSTLRAHRPFLYLGDIGRFRPFHLSHKLCMMKIYTSAVFCKNIGCFSPTSAVLTQTSAVLTQTSAALLQTSAVLTQTSAVLAQHRPFSTVPVELAGPSFFSLKWWSQFLWNLKKYKNGSWSYFESTFLSNLYGQFNYGISARRFGLFIKAKSSSRTKTKLISASSGTMMRKQISCKRKFLNLDLSARCWTHLTWSGGHVSEPSKGEAESNF